MVGDIDAAAFHRGDGQKTSLQSRDSKISALCRVIFDKVREYDGVEKSPKRRIETLEKVSITLKELAARLGGVKSCPQKMLAYVGLGLSRSEKLLWAQIKHVENSKHKQTSSFPSRIVQAFSGVIVRPAVIPNATKNFIFNRVKASKIEDHKWRSTDLILCHLRSSICRSLSRRLNMKFFVAFGIKSDLDAIVQSSVKKVFSESLNSDESLFRSSVCRTLKKLKPAEASSLDPRIVGGLPAYKTVREDLREFLKDCGEKLHSGQVEHVGKFLQQMKDGEEIIIKQQEIKVRIRFPDGPEVGEAKIADLAYRIEKQIERLSVGESCLIPGGYHGKEGGHTVVFEVQRTSERDFQFVIYNTGEGLELGLSDDEIWRLERDSLAAPLAIQKLTMKAVSDQNFLMDILRPGIDWNPEIDSMEKLFFIVTKHLVGEHNGTCTRLKNHERQSWGTCSFDSIRSYLKTKMEPELFAQFEAHMMKRAYDTLYRLLPEMRASCAFNKETLDLIERKAQSAPV